MVFQLLIISCPPSNPNEHLQGVHLTLVLCLHTEAERGELLLGKRCFLPATQTWPGRAGWFQNKLRDFPFCLLSKIQWRSGEKNSEVDI